MSKSGRFWFKGCFVLIVPMALWMYKTAEYVALSGAPLTSTKNFFVINEEVNFFIIVWYIHNYT